MLRLVNWNALFLLLDLGGGFSDALERIQVNKKDCSNYPSNIK
jgi:hypothetical protein